MQKNLLPIKPAKNLHRQDLITEIEQALVDENKCVLLKAPAGFGKSYLLIDYAYKIQQTEQKLLWTTLDADDNSAEYFFTYFLQALKDLSLISDKLYFDENISALRFINQLTEELEASQTPVFLFFDDFQYITDPVISDFFQHLMLNTSDKIKVVVASRVALPFPTSKAVIANKIHKIMADKLAFNCVDIAKLANETFQTKIDDNDLHRFFDKTNGWPAIISLELNSGNASFDQEFTVSSLNDSNKNLTKYFYEEVISALNEEQLEDLLKLSLSNFLCSELSIELTGNDDFFTGSLTNVVPCIKLDDSHLTQNLRWFSIHPLLRGFLRQKFYAEPKFDHKQLNLIAANWFLKQKIYIEAVEHYILAEAFDAAVDILDDKGIDIIASGNFPRFTKLISHLPYKTLISNVNVVALKGWFYALNYQHSSANSVLTTMESMYDPALEDHKGYHEQTVALKCANAAFSDSLYLLEDELNELFKQRPLINSYAENSLRAIKSFICLHNDDFDGLDELINEGEFFAQGGDLFYSTIVLKISAAMLAFVQGRFDVSLSICQAIEKFINKQTHESQLHHIVQVMRGMICYVQGDLTQALEYFEQSGNKVRYLSEPSFLSWYYACHIQLLTELNQQEQRELLIEEISELNNSRKISISMAPVVYEAIDNYFYLNHDDDALACFDSFKLKLASYKGAQSRHWILNEVMVDCLILTRQGKYDEVKNLLIEQANQYEASGRVLQQVKCLLNLVNIYEQTEEYSQAKLMLKKAISISYKRNIVQYFSRLSNKAIHYIQDWALTELSPKRKAFMVDICERFDGFAANSQAIAPKVVALTAGEQKIMELLNEGFSNKDIADKLCLSINTIKTHLKAIYVKLGASNRIQATRIFNQSNFL
ncbi:LuxR C-terminal-related transcriptional regulator [Thalassomonas sp. M1454]|uniref:LuxR C-terminal-related transcriptional regulator n=1 Tax=Thalassomonas sp. M1454 TaxID=2594477 RepID=UPI0011813CD9|nr:LuxR C-terminal-related transcriptional regulator [Thalassomonas sp. M1454]TRX56521.1 hypothetical protein FNN08_03025 [Thalassomonas sp. M1454]